MPNDCTRPNINKHLINRVIDNPSLANSYDQLTRYILAKLLSEKDIENIDIDRYIQKLKHTPSYKFYQSMCDAEEKAIFSEKNNQYVWFIAKTQELDHEILTSVKGFSIREAKQDLFYVPRKQNELLAKYLNEGENVLLKGPLKVGKTRLVFDELRKLKAYYVFSLSQLAFHQIQNLIPSKDFNKEKRKLIWFIDDIQYNATPQDAIWLMYEKLTTNFGDVLVIATLRETEEIETRLLKYMQTIHIPVWTEEEGKKLADHYGYDINQFSGTPFSLIKNIQEMKDIYHSSRITVTSKNIMRYLKLLYQFLPYVYSDILEDIFLYLRKSKGRDEFELALDDLEKAGFLQRRDVFVLTWEPYLEDIITKKDYWRMDSDMDKLISFFANNNNIEELECLECYYYNRDIFAKGLSCSKRLISIATLKDDISLKGNSYYNWSLGLYYAAKRKSNDEQLYEDALRKCNLSFKYRKDSPYLYCLWGNILYMLGKIRKSAGLYLEACSKYKLATKHKRDYADAYARSGDTFSALAEIKRDNEELYLRAIDQYNLAIRYEKGNSTTYYDCAGVLERLAEIKNDLKLYKQGIKYYALSIKYKKDFADAYLGIGNILLSLAKITGNYKLYLKASKRFKLAIRYKTDFAAGYYNLATALHRYTSLTNEKEDIEYILRLFLQSFLLSILQNKWNQAYNIALGLFTDIASQYQNRSYYFILQVFFWPVMMIYKSKELSEDSIESLKKVKGWMDETDIVVDAIIKNKTPEYDLDKISDEDLVLKAAVFLANEIVSMKQKD